MEPGHIEFVHRSWPADPTPARGDPPRARELARAAATDRGGDRRRRARRRRGRRERRAARLRAGRVRRRRADALDRAGAGESDATLSIEIVDHGHWRPPGEPHVGGGRGIPLMSNVVESVLIHYDDRGSRVLLRHRLPVRGYALPAAGRTRPRRARRRGRAGPARAGRASGVQRPPTGAYVQLAPRVTSVTSASTSRSMCSSVVPSPMLTRSASPLGPQQPREQRVGAEPPVPHADAVLGREVGRDVARGPVGHRERPHRHLVGRVRPTPAAP